MAVEEIGRLRTIAIVGQGGTGKTQLCDAMLFTAGATTRLGRPDDGSAATDFEPEEINHHISINAAFHHFNWKKTEVIFADTPGYSAFLPETITTLRAVDSVVMLVSPGADTKVESEKIWAAAEELKLPHIAFVSRLDRERTSFDSAMKDLEKILGAHPVALTIPIGEELNFKGVIDVLAMKALTYSDASGKAKEEELSGDLKAQAEAARSAVFEAVAETDDALLEKYLEAGTLEEAEVRSALHAAVLAGKITPVFCGSGAKNVGVGPLLDAIMTMLPAPNERPPVECQNPTTGEAQNRPADPAAPLSALVFKTVIDPFAGKLSIFRVISGRAQSDATVYNSSRESKERFGQLLRLEGKKQSPIASAIAGEIVAVAKLKDTTTGDTLCDEKAPVLVMPPLTRPTGVISFAVRPKSKNDEEKSSAALQKLLEEDLALEMHRDPQTHDIILSGTGQMHIELTVEKLRRKFNVDVELQAPKVPYKETIKGRAESQGKYKRQSGGRGQYGDCWLKIEPNPRGKGFEFVDQIVGGVIPRNFIPSVEKGVRNTLPEGFLAGYPMVDVKVTVFDGSYHDVDSSDMAFQIAASMGFKAALEKAKPIILEPIVAVEVACPDECMGDVIGDLNSRRGKVLGMDSKGHGQVIKAQVPMSEVLKYAPDLRSITSGRGSFEQHFSHYEEAPAPVAEKIIKETHAAREAAGAKAHAHA
ncbi:MAG: elongation factor G [Candidatus Binatus sp.]|uniref:elongation factor G n=1 Tax=Candidatus Binatus sp. TaxID=2811406 RepID=UPI002725D13C|nr:elongation factor G [Candidatus Binatus sp.]MDO8433182.1 elongation factor G [Candidatus Binatus sp.]